ncbi:MAG: NUDIX hydrolase [Opitutaceae bacterium]|nr:NUDIX hydrolase [Opitutaceae bacterium]
MKPWKTLSSRTEFTTPWFSIRSDTCQDWKGRTIEPYYVMETLDWVHVVAVDGTGKMIVVRQWRPASGTFVDELPGGIRDKGEAPLDTAKRELLEETGAVSDNWIQAGVTYPDPARLNNRVWTFLARDIRFEHLQNLDENEDLAVRLEPLDAIPSLISAGEFMQATQIASYFLAREVMGKPVARSQ